MFNTKIETITSIEDLGVMDDWVYDITMEDDTTPYFFGNGILVHNSCYFSTFADNIEDAVKVADYVANKVNKSFPKFMRDSFCCKEGFDEYIEAEREIVAAAGIFVKPKHYILNVVDLEGKSCDYMKVMGIATKKTTMPKEYQDVLNSILERYIKGEEWSSIAEAIVSFKETLMTETHVTKLGLPKGIKQVEAYTEKFEKTQVMGRTPGHVRAAMLYNNQLKERGDTGSFPIRSDMKIKVYYLKQPIGLYKSIALPTDLDIIPEWFYEYDIDKSAQVERLVDNALKSILATIEKVPPSRQTMLVEDLLVF